MIKEIPLVANMSGIFYLLDYRSQKRLTSDHIGFLDFRRSIFLFYNTIYSIYSANISI